MSLSDKLKLLTDPAFNTEFKTLFENHWNSSLSAELDTTLTLAQLIIDSNIAPESVIQELQSFATKWRSVPPSANLEEIAKFKVEYKMALGEYGKYSDMDGFLNYFTNGGYTALKVKLVNEDKQRRTAYKEMVKALKANLRLETQKADNPSTKALATS